MQLKITVIKAEGAPYKVHFEFTDGDTGRVNVALSAGYD